MRLILTDLDGTLIDHHTYSADAAAAALREAREHGVPIVLCSSKTLAEMRPLAARLRLVPAPLIAENGGAIWFPAEWPNVPPTASLADDGGRLLVLGARADDLRPKLEMLAAATGTDLRGFSVMTDAEVADRTGLTRDVAVLARQRQFSEPFVCATESVELTQLDAAARALGARVTRGGRFFHLVGPTDKGAAVRVVAGTCPPGTRTLGLGDAPNDLPLLQAVDDAAIVPQPSGLHPSLVTALPHARHAPVAGPAGWNAIVLAWLADPTVSPACASISSLEDTRSMADSPSAYAGPIPAQYDSKLGPMLFEPHAREIARRLPASASRVLEVAAGTGIVSRHLLAHLGPGASLVVSDLQPAMLAIAAGKVGDDPRVTFQQADAHALPFGDYEFDAVVFQFGLMFLAHPEIGLRECRRVLAHGGVLLLSTWGSLDENPVARIAQEEVRRVLADAPPFLSAPFAMHDAEAVVGLLHEAGFTYVQSHVVELTAESPSAYLAATGMLCGSPTYTQLQERGITDPRELIDAVAARLAREGGFAPMRLPMKSNVFTAQ